MNYMNIISNLPYQQAVSKLSDEIRAFNYRKALPGPILLGASGLIDLVNQHLASSVRVLTTVTVNGVLGIGGTPLGFVTGGVTKIATWSTAQLGRLAITATYGYAAYSIGNLVYWRAKHGWEFQKQKNWSEEFANTQEMLKTRLNELKVCQNTLLSLSVTYLALDILGLDVPGFASPLLLPISTWNLARLGFYVGSACWATAKWIKNFLDSTRVIASCNVASPHYNMHKMFQDVITTSLSNGSITQGQLNVFFAKVVPPPLTPEQAQAVKLKNDYKEAIKLLNDYEQIANNAQSEFLEESSRITDAENIGSLVSDEEKNYLETLKNRAESAKSDYDNQKAEVDRLDDALQKPETTHSLASIAAESRKNREQVVQHMIKLSAVQALEGATASQAIKLFGLKDKITQPKRTAHADTPEWLEEQKTLTLADLNKARTILGSMSVKGKRNIEKRLLLLDLANLPEADATETDADSAVRWLGSLCLLMRGNDFLTSQMEDAILKRYQVVRNPGKIEHFFQQMV